MKEAKERGRRKDMVGVLLPLIPLFDLMCLCIGLMHMERDNLILHCCAVLILWHLPGLQQLQPCSPQTHQCYKEFIFSAHEGDRFWDKGWGVRGGKALDGLNMYWLSAMTMTSLH